MNGYVLYKLQGSDEVGNRIDDPGDGPLYEGLGFAGTVEADSPEHALELAAQHERSAPSNKGIGKYAVVPCQILEAALSASGA